MLLFGFADSSWKTADRKVIFLDRTIQFATGIKNSPLSETKGGVNNYCVTRAVQRVRSAPSASTRSAGKMKVQGFVEFG